jgi:paraquat-inducible protein B
MGKKPNPTLIGAFVLGAIALAVAGVLVFGSGQYFEHTERYVMFFPGSVNGLNIGAPVKFKGVDIGTVTDIRLVFQPTVPGNEITIPVYVRTDPSKISLDGQPLDMDDPEQLRKLIAQGLRAQLQTQSLVTGLLFVQIDFFPDTEAKYVLPQPSRPMEIPTIPTALEQASSVAREIIDELRKVKFGPMIEQAQQTLDSIHALMTSPALSSTVESLPGTVANLNETVASLRNLSQDLSRQVGALGTSMDRTLEGAADTLETVRDTAGAAKVLIEPGSPLDHDLRSALQDVGTAARALSQLADYLERNPSALIYGKPPSNQEPQ